MELGFNLYRKFEDGDVLLIAWRPDLNEAEELMRGFMDSWPGEYGIRAEGVDGPISWVGG